MLCVVINGFSPLSKSKQRTDDDDDGTHDGTDGRTEDGRRRRDTTRHDGTDGQRTDNDDWTDDWTDGRIEYDDDDNRTDTTGRTDGRTMYIVPKFQIRHWDQYFSVKVNRP